MHIHTSLFTRNEGGDERLDFDFDGTHAVRGNRHLLTYDDPDNGGRVQLMIAEDAATLHRTGHTHSKMHFRKGHKHRSDYRTPMGALTLLIETRHYTVATRADGGALEVHYDLFLNNAHVSRNELRVTWTL